MKLLLAGGGTGGHLFPAIAVAEQLRREEPHSEILFVGTERGLEFRLLPKLGWPLQTIEMSGFAGLSFTKRILALGRLVRGLGQARRILGEFRPDLIVGVGGYASVPVLLAAKLTGVPFMIHEQNAWPGLANRLFGRWAKRICLSFSEAGRAFHGGITVMTGNPVRSAIESCPETAPEPPCLLVFGCSHGARSINRTLLAALPYLRSWQGRLQILHQSGERDFAEVQDGYAAQGWTDCEVKPFIDDMGSAYARASLVVCRAGATTLAELAACGRPAILIPYPHAAGNHQSSNAQALVARGAALMFEEHNLQPEQLAGVVSELLRERNTLQQMAAAAKSQAQLGAAQRLLDECRAVVAESY
ncbi:MAG: undecaprenyldiphospho-muramoylpentapeptide beta-N-acetylglucosaminyltransferase [Desulfuromonas sp.]|nr:MAG: undecaprenyldiphospho-muramoylpentapeptide beta-N-acetylglucosaminyltransferase [Desulfuromonas sp.]